MKLATLKPSIPMLKSSPVVTIATERLRGRGLQERNVRFLHHNPLCAECLKTGQVTEAREVDHVTPLWAGGADSEENLQGLCVACHAAKTAQEAAQRAVGGQIGSTDGLSGNPRPSQLRIKNPLLEPGDGPQAA